MLVFIVMRPFIGSLAWACILAYATWPLSEKLRKKCGGRDSLAAGLSTLLAAITLLVPLLWLAWLAQQEIAGVFAGLRTLLASPPEIPKFLLDIPWFGEWLTQQRQHLLGDPQGVSEAVKIWLRAHTDQVAMLAGGLGRTLARLIVVLVVLFFFSPRRQPHHPRTEPRNGALHRAAHA